jgi:hypothetical protein
VIARSAAIAALCLLCGCGGTSPQPEAPPPGLGVAFRGVWFSEDEQRRIAAGERNVQPTRDVELAVWEYTDPVASPHPDVVNVVVAVTNPASAPAIAGSVSLRAQWKIGGPEGEERAAWGDVGAETLSKPVEVPAGGTTSVALPVAVGEMVRRLARDDRYPWRLRVLVELRETASSRSLAAAQSELPIIPGD